MHNTDEGYIKFDCQWIDTGPMNIEIIKEMNAWRDKMYHLKLIGEYRDLNIGYGNISQRIGNSPHFVISGTQTGKWANLDGYHYTQVVDVSPDFNRLICTGPIRASSESMTHAAFYICNPDIGGVIHIHSLDLWTKLMDVVPTSCKSVPYGTPEMAYEIGRLYRDTDLADKKTLVMGGHREGLITFGRNLDEAGQIILDYL